MKKNKGISLIFSILLSLACFLTGFNSLFGLKNYNASAEEAGATTELSLSVGDSVYFGEYPQSNIPNSEIAEFITAVNKLKYQNGLQTWFNADGTSKITNPADVKVTDFILDPACKDLGRVELLSDSVSYRMKNKFQYFQLMLILKLQLKILSIVLELQY